VSIDIIAALSEIGDDAFSIDDRDSPNATIRDDPAARACQFSLSLSFYFTTSQ
jgi:hypothetical protein